MKVVLGKKYKGCYIVLNFKAGDIDDVLLPQWNLKIAHSVDTKGKWIIEGGSRYEYNSKKEAIKAIENNELTDIKLIELTPDSTRVRRRLIKEIF